MLKKTAEDKKSEFDKQRIFIAGVGVHFVGMQKALFYATSIKKYNKKHHIVTPNPEQIVLAQKNKYFRKVLNAADLAIADGVGLLLAGRLLKGDGEYSFQRVSGMDLMLELCKYAAQNNQRVFLLGGKGETAQQAVQKLQKQDKQLEITYFKGAEDISQETEKERKQAIKKINQFKPDFLFVAYGAPWQELWIAKNLVDLQVKVAMGVGGSFDYLGGNVQRAPVFIQKIGFEWLWRLFKQPWRWKRQLRLFKFVGLVIGELVEK